MMSEDGKSLLLLTMPRAMGPTSDPEVLLTQNEDGTIHVRLYWDAEHKRKKQSFDLSFVDAMHYVNLCFCQGYHLLYGVGWYQLLKEKQEYQI